MVRWAVMIVAVLSLAVPSYAQETSAGPGVAEVTIIPGGGMFFVSGDTETSFGNYNLGGAFTYNVNRFVGLEGEMNGTLGITQSLMLGGSSVDQKTPNMFGYTGNIVISASARHGTVPYATGGIGGLTMYETSGLGIDGTNTFFTGNVGGGVKWYANNRMGVRGDYRFTMVQSNPDAPTFFGQETRYSHRFYAGLVLNLTR